MHQLIQKNIGLDRHETITNLLSFVHNNCKPQLSYDDFTSEQDLLYLSQSDYFVQPWYEGIDVLVVIKKFDDYFYSVLMRTGDDSEKNNHQKFIPLNCKIHANTYNGTICRAICLQEEKKIIITDVYVLEGTNLQNNRIDYNFMNTKEYFKTHIKSDQLIVNDIYPVKSIKECFNHTNSKGMLFTSDIKAPKLLYLYKEGEPSNIGHITVVETKIFKMCKTSVVDIYKLFDKDEFIGIAYVSNMEYSHLYKSWFNDITDAVSVKCQLIKKKWVPLHII